jgi:glycosyltransferase involved in cell wall biosynthesis
LIKILFITPYPIEEAPSQRFRFEQYFNALKKHEYTFRVEPFLPAEKWKLFYSKGHTLEKIVLLSIGFLRRFIILFKSSNYNYIFIHREAAPIGPPFLEFILAKLLKRRIIFDFDDAIWLTDKIDEGRLEKLIRWRIKVNAICRWSYRVSCGNEYLCDHARQFNPNVILNPTTIDTEQLHNPALFSSKLHKNEITIGWTGSHTTLKYLDMLKPLMQELELANPLVSFLVIANRKPELALKRMYFVQWNKKTEIRDLLLIDIGIMPLPDDAWAKGKCGFKALQYMALKIPCIGSPVGVNTTIIDHGINGFLATSIKEWRHYLNLLIADIEIRKKMGVEGREKIIKNYSVLSNSNTFLSLFQ